MPLETTAEESVGEGAADAGSRLKILLVEDDLVDRMAFERFAPHTLSGRSIQAFSLAHGIRFGNGLGN